MGHLFAVSWLNPLSHPRTLSGQVTIAKAAPLLTAVSPVAGSLSQLAMGCVTCHTCHGCVMDFRPILGNPVEVTHITSPGHVCIFPCSGNLLPLARISTSLPPYLYW